MSSYSEANQVKLALKMQFSHFWWYDSITLGTTDENWCVIVSVNKLDSSIKKLIPNTLQGISVKIDTGGKKIL
jgi:hypothetical protein